MRSLRILLLTALAAALPVLAMAQTAPSTPSTEQQPTLSDKLNATDGVIAPPPSGDADMTQTPPNVGAKMPVIPPRAVTPPGEAPGGPTPDPK
jgi:hypothetical protein